MPAKYVMIAGPNLHSLTNPQYATTARPALFSWLRDRPGRSCDLLISKVLWGDPHGAKAEDHLRESKKVLARWVRRARSERLALTVWLTGVVRASAMLIDP